MTTTTKRVSAAPSASTTKRVNVGTSAPPSSGATAGTPMGLLLVLTYSS
jgi:hypothetical protein